ncbi:ATP-binding cassette subfamily B multidrug efflux pump [Defluviimonas denitrificans]|jgi:ATP-binding cassette subfamily B multidrug efflux pump|uniref:ATP-binding cassette subfamily B multidrug efflux pump n=1 Tax=Albidovulum denitrificans TaxID=404881 RepID=A0A2S8S8N3_9RHOB|nr:ABC transporter ATP-binding protein [Defluviimonas denitrificans]PQV57154.1 ATP-binding cassette subfamily B multidrug efflux pump [Defluviimonas denitrificans]
MFRFFENLVDPYVEYEETDTPPRRLLPFLIDYARPFRRVFVVTGVLKMVVAVIEVGMIWYVGRLVDLLAGGSPAEVMRDHGAEFLFAAIAVLCLRPIIGGIDVALLHNTILPNFGTLIRWRSHRHVLRQPVGWFENDFAGRIANRIMQTPPAAGDALFQVFDAVAFAVTTLIGSIALLSGADLRLVVPLLLWIALYLWLLRWTVRRAGPASTAASDARSKVTGRVVDSYTNIHSVKMFAHHDREIAYAGEAIEEAREKFQTEMRIVTLMDVMLTFINGLLIVSVTGLALWLWYDGQATVGVVAAATALVLRLNNMTYWIMWATTNLVQSLGVVAEGMETIAQPVALTDRAGAKPLDYREGRIEIDTLSHHYGRGAGGLDKLSLTIRPGEKVGLVGRSGSGKSTLVKLLLRFYDPEGGRILIDGQDITHVTQNSLRRVIGMVQQDSSLLHRSVRDNILYGRPDATEAEMIRAAQRAEADGFIGDLADPEGRSGYDAQVGERGVKLSGGQRQRVALARVILKDAPILVLDEATSALDSEVEAAILDTLYGVMEGKTVIAIAHRLSTIAHMDRIVVIDGGQIVESGTHAALLAKGGLYAQFWDRQSGGFIGTDESPEAAQ